MGKEVVAIAIMALFYRVFSRRQTSVPVPQDRRKSQLRKRLHQSFDKHREAIKEQLKTAEELLKK